MKKSLYLLMFLIFNNCLYAQVSDFESIDFTRADNTARLHKDASLDNLPLLAHKLTYSLPTQVEKFRAIYFWVCHNIIGDYTQHTTVSNKIKKLKNDSIAFTKWNNGYKKIAFKKLLKRRKTMCTGYAYLIKELCYLASIECVIIDGYGRSVDANVKELEIANHSWNAVKLQEKWYVCDATWSSGYMVEGNIFMKDYNDGYFLASPLLFAKNHLPLDQKWLLNENITATTFVTAPLIYGEAFKHTITPLYPQNMEVFITKNDEIKFSFKMTKSISNNNVSLVYYKGNQEKMLKIYGFKNENNIISFYYKSRYRGTYDTHLKVNGDIVATYILKVAKNQKKSI